MTNEAYCYGCTHKPGCKEVCPDLEEYLDKESVKFKGMTSMLSADFQDKIFSKEYKTDVEAWEERRRYVERRKEAFSELLIVFGMERKCCGKSIRNFLVWQMRIIEELTVREVAEITGLSHQRIVQIVQEKKEIGKKLTSQNPDK